jgi:GHH signature containing HNH/Endo VII superfamily nuclease toxin
MLYSDPDGLKVKVCDTFGNCTNADTDLTDAQWDAWFRGDKSIRLGNGNVYKNGELIGHYEQISCDTCLYDIQALGRQVAASDPGNRAVRVWGASVMTGLTLPSAAPGWIALGVLGLIAEGNGGEEPTVALTTTEHDRRYAVQQAWKQEAEMVRRTGRGTRAWTPDELRELRDTGKVSGYQGHHINSVKGNEGNRALIRNPDNIEFVRAGKAEHIPKHFGNTRNPSKGPLIPRR